METSDTAHTTWGGEVTQVVEAPGPGVEQEDGDRPCN